MKTCNTCFNAGQVLDGLDHPACVSCVEYSKWVSRDVFENIDDATNKRALDVQVSGNHYKDLAIQPVEYIHANNIGYFEGNVIKYVSRWRNKNGVKDLEKAKHYIDLLIELEGEHLD
jgi:hypothetical protein